MATARKTPSGKWRVQVFDYTDIHGKRKYKVITANSKKEAELLAAQWKFKKNRPSIFLSVNDTMTEYITLRSATCSPSTIAGYKKMQRVLNRSYPALMAKKIDKVNEKDIQGVISDLSLTKSPKTVRNYYGILTAISDDLKGYKISLPQIIEYEPYIPTEEEIQQLLDYVKGKEIEIPVLLGCQCMMRRGEIAGLSIDDVNFKNKTIHIRHSMVLDDEREWINKAPKTKKSNRIISVPDNVLEMIKEKGCITRYNPDQITDEFENCIDALELNHFRFHDLRHYCASVFHFQGIPMSYTQKYGGWSTLNTLTRIYQHTLSDKEDEVYKKMTNYFDATFSKNAT